MNKKLIAVAGYVAAGKTTFALRLSRELGVPCFSKDLLKSAISRNMPPRDRTDSKRLSAATFDAVEFVAERLMETAQPLIIEANFVMNENHGGIKEGVAIKNLLKKYGYQSLTFLFGGDLRVLHKRFIERDKSAERETANKMWEEMTFADFENAVKPLADFDIGGATERVDGTDFGSVDFERLIQTARRFVFSP